MSDEFDVNAAAAAHHDRLMWHDRSLEERRDRIRALGRATHAFTERVLAESESFMRDRPLAPKDDT